MANSEAFPFKAMTIYQEYKVSEKNVTDFIGAIESINYNCCPAVHIG